ncbi:hypothetical protein vseg_006605 [Gypsophila vaccaria]
MEKFLQSHYSGTQTEDHATYSAQERLVASLYREIEIRDLKIQEVEDKYDRNGSSGSNLLRRLVEQVEDQRKRIVELEHKCDEKEAACLSTSRLLVSLTKEIDRKNEENAGLVHHCNRMDRDIRRLRDEKYSLNKCCLVGARKMKATHCQNKKLKSDIKTVENELRQLVEGMDGAQTDQAQSFPMNLISSLQSHIRTLKTELEDKTDDIQYLQNLNETLIFREHMINNELVDARGELLRNLHTVVSSRAMIGIKRMGELNSKPFRDVCASKFTGEDCDAKCAEVCSLWEENFKDSLWHPFKHSIIGGSVQEAIDESDTRIEVLRKEWGEDAYKAVASALLELNEYNPSGRYPVPEIWNFREKRKASLKEVIGYIIQQLKTCKRKRR